MKHGDVDQLPGGGGSESKRFFDVGEEMGQGDDHLWIDLGQAVTEM